MWIRLAGLGREIKAINGIAAIRRQRNAFARFRGRASRLGELACHSADLHDRHLGGVGQHDGHREQGPKLALDVRSRDFSECLGTVTALQHECLTGRDAGHLGAQLVAFGCKYERGKRTKLTDDLGKLVG